MTNCHKIIVLWALARHWINVMALSAGWQAAVRTDGPDVTNDNKK